MELIKPIQHIPNDIVKLLLQFDGRIKYRNGHYIDTIDRNDDRYAMLDEVIKKKLKVYQRSNWLTPDVYIINIEFDQMPHIMISYYYNSAGTNYDSYRCVRYFNATNRYNEFFEF